MFAQLMDKPYLYISIVITTTLKSTDKAEKCALLTKLLKK